MENAIQTQMQVTNPINQIVSAFLQMAKQQENYGNRVEEVNEVAVATRGECRKRIGEIEARIDGLKADMPELRYLCSKMELLIKKYDELERHHGKMMIETANVVKNAERLMYEKIELEQELKELKEKHKPYEASKEAQEIVEGLQTVDALMLWFKQSIQTLMARRGNGSKSCILGKVYRKFDEIVRTYAVEGKPQSHGSGYKKGGRAVQIFAVKGLDVILVDSVLSMLNGEEEK